MDRKNIVYISGSILIFLGLLLLYWLAYGCHGFVPSDLRGALNIEIIKLVMNSLIVGGAGLILYGIRSASDHFQEDQKHKATFLKSVIENYNRVKSVRRRIRFADVNKEKKDEFCFDGVTLDELLLELNDAQLSLETSKRIARAKPRYLQPCAAQVEKRLETMEKFLNKVVKDSIGEFDKVSVSEANGGHLFEFIRRKSGSQGYMCNEELFSQMDGLIADLS